MLFLTILTGGIYGQTGEALHGVNSRGFQTEMAGKKSHRVLGKILEISKSTVATYLVRAALGKVTTLEQLNSFNDEDLKGIIVSTHFLGVKIHKFRVISLRGGARITPFAPK